MVKEGGSFDGYLMKIRSDLKRKEEQASKIIENVRKLRANGGRIQIGPSNRQVQSREDYERGLIEDLEKGKKSINAYLKMLENVKNAGMTKAIPFYQESVDRIKQYMEETMADLKESLETPYSDRKSIDSVVGHIAELKASEKIRNEKYETLRKEILLGRDKNFGNRGTLVGKLSGLFTLVGLLGGAFFYSTKITGNVVGVSTQTSSLIGVGLLIVGLISGFFWVKNKK